MNESVIEVLSSRVNEFLNGHYVAGAKSINVIPPVTLEDGTEIPAEVAVTLPESAVVWDTFHDDVFEFETLMQDEFESEIPSLMTFTWLFE